MSLKLTQHLSGILIAILAVVFLGTWLQAAAKEHSIETAKFFECPGD